MSRHAMQFTHWASVCFLLLALGAAQSSAAVSNRTSPDRDAPQQAAKPALPPELPQVSAETRADLLVIHHKYLAAIAAYQNITPRTARIYDKLGVAYEHMFMDADAKANFLRSLKMDKKSAMVYNNLGTVYYHEKNFKRAERYYKRSIRLDAKSAAVYGNLGTLFVARKKYHDAAEAYQRAFMLDPGVFEDIAENGIEEGDSVEDLQAMNYCFAQIYAQAGRNDLALGYLQKAVAEGFRDRERLQRDQQFAGLRSLPEFQNLLQKASADDGVATNTRP